MQLPYPSLAPFPKQDHIKHSPFPKRGIQGDYTQILSLDGSG